jgi:hypothetical protein
MTPIVIGDTPALLLGPLIVEPVFRSQGIGEALAARSLEAARDAGARLVILVGDEPYYARMGFKRVPLGELEVKLVSPKKLNYSWTASHALKEFGDALAVFETTDIRNYGFVISARPKARFRRAGVAQYVAISDGKGVSDFVASIVKIAPKSAADISDSAEHFIRPEQT